MATEPIAKRGFTLVEMMIAVSISVIVLGGVMAMLTSVWLLAKGSADELQGMLSLCAARERLTRNLMTVSSKKYGLRDATNVIVSAGELIAQFDDGKNFPANADKKVVATVKKTLDTRDNRTYKPSGSSLQYVYFAVSPRKNEQCYARMVISFDGRTNNWDIVRTSYR